MISKRVRRAAHPQEALRQFSLNNSKGIDVTKAPTEFSTIFKSNNLIVNPDGSMSIRKPIVYVEDTLRSQYTQQYHLYNGRHKLEVLADGDLSMFAITDSAGNTCPIRLKCTAPDGTVLSKSFSNEVTNIIFPQGTPEIINLNSATIVGNCTVNLQNFDGKGNDGVDFSLYDVTEHLPRYLQIRYAESDAVWDVIVKSPEVNTLTTAEGEIPLNPNLNLDNPTAIRDTYDAIVPTIKGIVAYVPSTIVNGMPVVSELAHASVSDTTKQVTRSYGKDYVAPDPQTNLINFESASTIHETLTFSDTFKDYKFECGLSLGLKLESNDRAVYSVHLASTCTVTSEYADNDGAVTYRDTSVKGVFDAVYSSDVLSNGVTRHLLFQGDLKHLTGHSLRFPGRHIKFDISITYTKTSLGTGLIPTNVITEDVRNSRFRIVNAIENATESAVILKAFCNIPGSENTTYYAAWFSSRDGIEWNEMREGGIPVKELSPTWVPNPYDKEDAKPEASDYVENHYFPFTANGFEDDAIQLLYKNATQQYIWDTPRIDVLGINTPGTSLPKLQYRFKIIAVEPLSEGMPEWENNEDQDKYRVYATVAQQDYTPVFKDEFEFFDIEFGNTTYGKKMYHRKALYSYGHDKFFNNIFVSDIDSFVTPLYNVIDLDARESSQVTCIVPWRDYLVSATNNAVYLHTKQADGFLTKTVNTSIGIPAEDYACCKAVLNGILFKSGPKIYQLYPNVYSGDDSTLNVTEISKPVEDILEEYLSGEYLPFAFSTESEYILMLPNAKDTTCLRYDYSSKRWVVCTYPIVATRCEIISLNDIRIFGIIGRYSAEFVFDSEPSENVYGDILPNGTQSGVVITPIEFEWDTGQKTDNISIQKQFVESKLIFSTEDTLEYFPMELTVHVDGDPHVTKLDLNSDAPFWKEKGSIGVANTVFRLGNESTSGVLRQLIVRYSGKGRSVRHILSGKPTSNFRLYETYVRYKTLNVKR